MLAPRLRSFDTIPRTLCLSLVTMALTRCGDDSGATQDAALNGHTDASFDVVLPPSPVIVRSVPWNAAGTDFGAIAAVAEPDTLLVLFGQHGMQLLAGGSVAATDNQVTMWTTAAVVPAGDGSAESWALGVDTMGRVWRVRDRLRLEEVTGRYGLAGRHVQSIARLSGKRVVFGFDGGLALADGMNVTVWSDPAFATLVGSDTRVAARTDQGVKVFDPMAGTMVLFTVAGVTGVAFDPTNRLVVTAGQKLYVENAAGQLEARVTAGPALRAVVRSNDRVWLVAGSQLALWSDGELHVAPDPMVPADAQTLPSPSGDVWVLSAGHLSRYGFVESPDLRLWEETVRPVFARRCVPCHLPGGTGNHDFTTYAAWQAGRMLLHTQVVALRAMPPPPGMLTDDERGAIAHWLDFDGGATDAGADDALDASADVRPDATSPADSTLDAPRPMDARADGPSDVRDASADVRDVPAGDGGPVTYSAVDAIFQRSCVRCHGAGASGSLNLSNPAMGYTALVNAPTAGPSCRGAGRVRVVPGNTMGSELYIKVSGTPDCGAMMPRGGPALPPADLDTIRRWIAGGALR